MSHMSNLNLPARGVAETQQLVRWSADEIVAALPGEVGFMMRDSLGNVACAIAISEDHDAGHEFAGDAINNLGLRPADAFSVWKDLYAEGDKEALSKARRAIGLASKQTNFSEEIGVVQLGGPYSAERLVELVEAGDTETMAMARGITKNVFVIDRTALFGKLYKAGDSESLDLAIEAAKAAKQHTEQTGDTHYHRSEQALYEMASLAVQNRNLNDVHKLMKHLGDGASIASLHVDLYKQGVTESLQLALDYLNQATCEYQIMRIERKLANAGYAPAIDAIKNRVNARSKQPRGRHTQPVSSEISSDLEDLVTLHTVGVEDADQEMAELIRSNETPQDYLHYLGRVGLTQTQFEIATELYETDPSIENAANLLAAKHNNGLWSIVFNHYLHKRRDTLSASFYVRSLAANLKR
jgi:hypothetical protein